jgi:exonuclease SbcC
MYSPEYIKIQNFGSIESMDYSFTPALAQIIQGKNLQDKGQRSNGVGKTSFIDALAFCYTGISVRKLTNDELIRDNERIAILEHSLRSKDGQDHLLIKRTLDRKSAQIVEIWKNGKALHKDEHDVTARNNTILREIGISQEDLFNFFIVTKERYKSYFRMSDTDKKAIVARFSNSYKVDKVFDLLDLDIAKSTKQIANFKLVISNLETKLNTYREEKENLSKNKEENTKKLKDNIQEKITEQNQAIIYLQEEITSLNDNILLEQQNIAAWRLKIASDEDIASKQSLIDELETSYQALYDVFELFKKDIETQTVAIEAKQKIIRTEIFEINQGINEVEVLKAQINSKLETAINCPKCDHSFILNSELSREELQSSLIETEQIIVEINAELVEKNKVSDSLKLQVNILSDSLTVKRTSFNTETTVNRQQKTVLLTTLQSIKKGNDNIALEIRKIENEILRIENQVTIKTNSITAANTKITTYESDILELDNEIDNSEAILRYDVLIIENELSLLEQQAELTNEEQELQRLNAWVLKFKSFKSYLANQSVKNIEELTNYYLDKMNTDLTVEISAQQKTKKEVKEKFSEAILRNGFPVGSYGRFSGGERGRIDFGLILCKQTLINNNAAPKGLDFLLIDEILESLDSFGIENIIRSMNGIDKILFLVTQNEINTLPKQTLTFVKSNGKTEIEK